MKLVFTWLQMLSHVSPRGIFIFFWLMRVKRVGVYCVDGIEDCANFDLNKFFRI